MSALRADRRLYVTADWSEVVEEGDVRGAFLLAPEGHTIGADDVAKFGLSEAKGRVVIGTKAAPAPENKMVAPPENKAEGWTLKLGPAEYLERYPDGKHADLARRILAAESTGGP